MPGVGVISGTVFDLSGAAIPGAKVVLIGADGISVDQSLTDNAGVFRFNNAADGEYIVDDRRYSSDGISGDKNQCRCRNEATSQSTRGDAHCRGEPDGKCRSR